MKNKIILLALLLTTLTASAFDYSQIQVINWLAPNADSLAKGGQKINADFILLAGWIADLEAAAATNSAASFSFTNTVTGAPGSSAGVTNLGNGVFQLTVPQGPAGANGVNGATGATGAAGANGVTNFSLTVSNTAPGTAPSVFVTGVTNGMAYIIFGLPQGSTGAAGAAGTNTVTNTITAFNFTNQMLQSKQITLFTTNYAFWTGSNYLGRFNGIVDWSLGGGDDGGANASTAPAGIPVQLYGTYATNNTGWFLLTNGFITPSNISLSVLSASTSSYGTPRINPGLAIIYSMDHWELYHRTNFMDYQFIGVHNPPTYGWQFVNMDYVRGLFGTAFNNNFSSSTDTNYVTHFVYSVQNHVLFDLTSHTRSVPAIDMVPAGFAVNPDTGLAYPTNVIMTIYATNLLSGYTLLAQTNLAGVFYNYTNFTASTASGITSLTIPIDANAGQMFFYAVNGFNFGATFNVPVTMPYVLFGTNVNYPSTTITHSTNSTFGYGAGLLACDTNYAYISVGTNSWRRIAITTNTW